MNLSKSEKKSIILREMVALLSLVVVWLTFNLMMSNLISNSYSILSWTVLRLLGTNFLTFFVFLFIAMVVFMKFESSKFVDSKLNIFHKIIYIITGVLFVILLINLAVIIIVASVNTIKIAIVLSAIIFILFLALMAIVTLSLAKILTKDKITFIERSLLSSGIIMFLIMLIINIINLCPIIG